MMPDYYKNVKNFTRLFALAFLFIGVAACSDNDQTPTVFTPSSTPSPIPTVTRTPFRPSPTPSPLAAIVNGEEITLVNFQAESARFQAAVGTHLATEDELRVLNSMIDQILLAQAAREEYFVVSETMLQDRTSGLTAQLGSAEALTDWIAAHGYTEESFRLELERSIASAWMRDHVIAEVPETAEQVHAHQILLYNSDQANEVLTRLRSGIDFAALAAEYDPVAHGDLGWFPRGYLLDRELEEAAFSLQPDEHSDVIETSAGLHILQLIERDPHRPLDPDARLVLQSQALQNWLESRRSLSDIQILLP